MYPPFKWELNIESVAVFVLKRRTTWFKSTDIGTAAVSSFHQVDCTDFPICHHFKIR